MGLLIFRSRSRNAFGSKATLASPFSTSGTTAATCAPAAVNAAAALSARELYRDLVEQATADRLNFSIAAPSFRREFMTFALRVAPGTGGNGCQVQVSITSFKTKQTKALGFIPAGKKRLLGYGQYQTFMNQFAAGVRAKDPSARVDITDGISRVL